MMSTSAPSLVVSSMPPLKAMEPLLAMTPRFCSSSSFVMPMPLSETVMVRASSSMETSMRKSSRLMPTLSSVRER